MRRSFPFLHWKLTLNYTYRGLWGTLITIAVLFIVSYMTRAPELAKVKGLTVDWSAPGERFEGLSDWRLHWSLLALATVAI